MAQQRKGLGKGLEALLGDAQDSRESIQEVAIGQIDPDRSQARKKFDDDKLQELADSIKSSGVIQPLIVTRAGDRFKIVAGERRFRAARIAGLKTLPVIVRDYSEQQRKEVSLIENLQREDLNPVEEAVGIKLLMDEHDLTQEEVGAKLGKSRSAVANTVRLLTLSEPVLEMLRNGELTAGHARVLVPLEDADEQLRIAKEITAKNLPVRAVERMAKAQPKARPVLDPALQDAADAMQSALGTKVTLSGNAERGRITIEYYSQDDLDRIYDAILN